MRYPNLDTAIAAVMKAAGRWPAGTPGAKGGQFAPKGVSGAGTKQTGSHGSNPYKGEDTAPPLFAEKKPTGAFVFGGLFGLDTFAPSGPKVPPKGAKLHPALNDHGEPVVINYPSKPSGKETWTDPKAVATFTPAGAAPKSLNGVPFDSWKPPADWSKVSGQLPHLDDVPFHAVPGKVVGAGVIIQEPDGRVWVTKPTNHYGGYMHTFPKGTVEKGLSLQASAIKEAYEETGLKVEITGIHGDFERTTSKARYFIARRVGGTPRDMGWESQALRLAPLKALDKLLNVEVDHKIAGTILSPRARRIVEKYNPLQPRWPEGTPLGGQWKKYKGHLVLPPVIAGGVTSKNPGYQKQVDAAFAAAEAGNWQAVEHAKAKLDEKMKHVLTKEKKSSHDKWTSQVHQYVTALVSDKVATPAVEAKAASLSGPLDLASMTKIAAKPGGSAAGAIYQDASGTKWLVKGYGDDKKAAAEVIASKFYEALGVNVPHMETIKLGSEHKGGIGVASKMLDEPITNIKPGGAAAAEAQKHFAAHVLVNNYDAVGLTFDNTVVGQFSGKVYMIDPGGSFQYKATTGTKPFGHDVNLWDTLRDPKVNPTGAALFGHMTADQLAESAKAVGKLSNQTIAQIVSAHHPGPNEDAVALSVAIAARRDAIMAKAGLVGTPMKAPEAKSPPPATLPSDTPKPVRDAFAPPPSSAFKGEPAGSFAQYAANLKTHHANGDLAKLNQHYKWASGTAESSNNNPNQKHNFTVLAAYAGKLKADLEAKQQTSTVTVPPVAAPSTTGAAHPAFKGSDLTKSKWAAKMSTFDNAVKSGDIATAAKMVEQHAAALQAGTSGGKFVMKAAGIHNTTEFLKYAAKVMPSEANAKAAADPTAMPAFKATAPGVVKAYQNATEHANWAFKSGKIDKLQSIHQSFKDASNAQPGNENAAILTAHIAGLINAAGKTVTLANTEKKLEQSVSAPMPKVAASSSVKPAMPVWESKKIPESNTNAKSHNPKIDAIKSLAESGNANAILAMGFGTNTYGKLQAKVANEALAALGSAHTVTAGQKQGQHPALGGMGAVASTAAQAAASVAEHAKAAGKFEANLLPKPPDFTNWNGAGKGLSSHPEFNAQNNEEVKHILGLAQTGHMSNVQDYVVKSPSKHVAQYKSDVLDAIDSMLHPPEPLKVMDHKAGTIDDVSKLFPSKFALGTKPETIKGNEKVGWYAALGVLKSNLHSTWKDSNKEPSQAWVQEGYKHYGQLSDAARQGITSQQKTPGPWRDNLNAGGNKPLHHGVVGGTAYTGLQIAAAWHKEAPEIPANSKMYRYLSLPAATVNKFLSMEQGTIFTDLTAQCASHINGRNTGFGPNKIELICLPGSKGMRSFGSKDYQTEMETTLLPGARMILHKVRKRKNGAIKIKAFLLPPDHE